MSLEYQQVHPSCCSQLLELWGRQVERYLKEPAALPWESR